MRLITYSSSPKSSATYNQQQNQADFNLQVVIIQLSMEAKELYELHYANKLDAAGKSRLIELRRQLGKKSERKMPPLPQDSVWYHPELNPSGTPPDGEKQVWLWQVEPMDPDPNLDVPLPDDFWKPAEVQKVYESGPVLTRYEGFKPRQLH